MPPNRREFLATMAAAAVLPACAGGPGPEPSERWQPEGAVDEERFAWGVVVADVTVNRARVSVRTTASTVSLEWVQGTSQGWEEAGEVALELDDMGVGQATLRELSPDTTYAVVARAEDGSVSTVSRFRTALGEGDSRVLRFGATSCLGGNFPWESLSRAGEEQLDLFLLLGDTIYNDWWSGSLFDKWGFALAQTGMRDLTASTSLLATWDDHEVRNNWNPESATHAAMAREAADELKRAIPSSDGGGEYRLWRSRCWGAAAEFFVLDCRGERAGSAYMSDEQLEWLEAALLASPARFKIVLNSVPITNLSDFGSVGEAASEDRWQGYPETRTRLLQHIADAGITGVLWVSGDFHVGAIARVDLAGGPAADQWEVLTGPGGSPIHELWSIVPETERITTVVPTHNYTLFRCDPDTGQVTVRFIADDGTELRRQTLQL